MRITIGAIGRLKDGAERELFDRYAGRVDKAGRSVAIGPLNLVQHNESRVADVEQRQNDEADRLLLSCQSAERVVALDETGRPSPVPPLLAESDDQRRRLGAAEQRRERRLERRLAEGMG